MILRGGLLQSCLVVLAVSGQEGRHPPRDRRSLTVPGRAVGRKGDVDLVRPLSRGFESGPDHGQYGLRHALPAGVDFVAAGWGTLWHLWIMDLSAPEGDHELVVKDFRFPPVWERPFEPRILSAAGRMR